MKTVSCWLKNTIDTLLHRIDARALFERVIGTFPPDRARPLWERWARHEYQYGDLAAAQKLEKRMAEAYPNGKNVSHSNTPRLTPGQTPRSSVSPNVTRIIPRMQLQLAIWVSRLRGRVVARLARAVQPIHSDARTPKRRF
jgi:Suppressor of forked protein (Suf)